MSGRFGRLAVAAVLALVATCAVAVGRGEAADNWSGPYIGLSTGLAVGKTRIGDGGTAIANPPFGAFACGPALTGNYCAVPFEIDPIGWVGGAQAGFNWRSGQFLYGLEVEAGWLGVSEDRTLYRPFNDRDIASIDYGAFGTFTGRVGYVSDGWLVYAKGGLALVEMDITAADVDNVAGAFVVYEGSRTRLKEIGVGWAVGGGLEYALTPQMTLRAEYLHIGLGSRTSTSSDGDIYRHANELDMARIGVNFKLNP